jgi:hypothetical protein
MEHKHNTENAAQGKFLSHELLAVFVQSYFRDVKPNANANAQCLFYILPKLMSDFQPIKLKILAHIFSFSCFIPTAHCYCNCTRTRNLGLSLGSFLRCIILYIILKTLDFGLELGDKELGAWT